MREKVSIKSPSKRVHVISKRDGWAVKKEGAARASKIYETKESAIAGAEKVAKKSYDVVIHKKDGTIQSWKKFKVYK